VPGTVAYAQHRSRIEVLYPVDVAAYNIPGLPNYGVIGKGGFERGRGGQQVILDTAGVEDAVHRGFVGGLYPGDGQRRFVGVLFRLYGHGYVGVQFIAGIVDGVLQFFHVAFVFADNAGGEIPLGHAAQHPGRLGNGLGDDIHQAVGFHRGAPNDNGKENRQNGDEYVHRLFVVYVAVPVLYSVGFGYPGEKASDYLAVLAGKGKSRVDMQGVVMLGYIVNAED
jgi:hypothetical protein